MYEPLGPGEKVQDIFVPGRVCLFGEHSDWAGSFTRFNAEITPGVTIVCGTNQGIHARVRRHPSSLILTTTMDSGEVVGPAELPMDPDQLLRVAQEGGFWSYAAGVAYKVCVDYRVGGLEVHNYRTDLPIRKGLSSSAALCVLIARAFNRMYDMKMTIRGEMEYAYQGELTTPSRCGRMDQGCAYGNRAIVMRYDGEFVGVEALSLRGPPLHYVVVDLAGEKSTTEILAALQAGYPFPRDDTAAGVHRLLGPLNEEICGEAIRHLEAGDARALGGLMSRAQQLFDELAGPACPSQLSAPLLHRVLAHEALAAHVWGGKGVGSQGDGAAQLLARSAEDQAAAIEVIRRDFGMEALALTLAPSGSVRTAVIPAAGFSPSLYPASKVTKTELFPVVTGGGAFAKPAVLVHVEELVGAGIERVVLVAQPEDVPLFERLFHRPDSHENFSKLSPSMQQEAERLLEIGRRVRIVAQPCQEGFGHALFCAEAEVGGEPFLLAIGHHLYCSTVNASVAAQVLGAYGRHQAPIVSLKQTPLEEVHMFGTACGVWLPPEAERQSPGLAPEASVQGTLTEKALADVGLAHYADRFAREKLLYCQLPSLTNEDLKDMGIPLGPRKRMLEAFARLPQQPESRGPDPACPSELRVTKIVEKPTHAYARENLAMANPALPPDTFLTAFGLYVLTPEIFPILKRQIQNNARECGSFQLTSALDELRKDQGLVGICVAGERYNIGTPQSFLRSLQDLQLAQ